MYQQKFVSVKKQILFMRIINLAFKYFHVTVLFDDVINWLHEARSGDSMWRSSHSKSRKAVVLRTILKTYFSTEHETLK
jgi:hypothetical protein